MSKDDVNAEMNAHARAAADMVRAEYGQELDFTEPTIGAVEAILNGFSVEGGNAELFGQVSLLFGSYIGEMIRGSFPEATWVRGSATPDAPSQILRVGDILLYPISWCFKRLYNGPADSVVKKYLAFREAADSRMSDG
jgi:hypothetical protein